MGYKERPRDARGRFREESHEEWTARSNLATTMTMVVRLYVAAEETKCEFVTQARDLVRHGPLEQELANREFYEQLLGLSHHQDEILEKGKTNAFTMIDDLQERKGLEVIGLTAAKNY